MSAVTCLSVSRACWRVALLERLPRACSWLLRVISACSGQHSAVLSLSGTCEGKERGKEGEIPGTAARGRVEVRVITEMGSESFRFGPKNKEMALNGGNLRGHYPIRILRT